MAHRCMCERATQKGEVIGVRFSTLEDLTLNV